MSASASPTPHKFTSPINTNPFHSPLRRPVKPLTAFAFDIEALQKKSAVAGAGVGSPVKLNTLRNVPTLTAKEKAGGALIGKKEIGGVNRQRHNRQWDGGSVGGSIPAKMRKKHTLGSAVPGTTSATATTTNTTTTTTASATAPARATPPMRIFGTTKSTSILGSEQDKPPQLSSSPVLSSPPKQASISGGDKNLVERQQDRLLISALLERRRLLEYECKNLKRKRDELEAEVEGKKKESEAQRKKIELDPASPSLGALVASLLATNDSTLSASITATKAGTITLANTKSKPMPTATTTIQNTEFIPTARPLPAPASPNHPFYRSFCPFHFSSHAITVLPISDTPVTEPPTTITHHVLKGHTPYHLLSFRFEFDVARPLAHAPTSGPASNESTTTATTVIGGGGSTSTVAALPITCVSTYAQPELHHIFAIARRRRNLLLAMTALTEYHRLSTLRAEAFSLLSRIYSPLAEANPGQRKGGSSRGGGGGGGVMVVHPVGVSRRNCRAQGRRASLLPFLGEREMLFRETTEAEAKGERERENNKGERGREQQCAGSRTGVQMLVVWDLDFDQATGLGESKLSVEVALPGCPHARRRNLKAAEPPLASPGEAMHAVKLDVEKAFAELVHHAGFVRAVRTIVGVLFDAHVKPGFSSSGREEGGGGGGRQGDGGDAE